MERAHKIITDIVARCKYEGIEVSETLAAFIARTVVHESQKKLILEKEMSKEDEHFLIDKCVTTLLQQREPSLETVKMQLEFDFCYANLEEEIRQRKEKKDKSIKNLQRSISTLVPTKASDFETLTTLYKQIFTLLMLHANTTNNGLYELTVIENRSVEKEVAAALESVFPRIGLKSFVTMTVEDKKFQLEELTRIVEGIRLFNKELGKGGAGINLTVNMIQDALSSIVQSVSEELQEANEVCTQYTEVLLHVHHLEANTPDQKDILRWQQELGNRRQFLSYLQSLQEDMSVSAEKIQLLIRQFNSDMNALKSLVGARTSLPKSQVYPLFETISKSWEELTNEFTLLQARSRAFKSLMNFKDSFDRSLNDSSELVRLAKKAGTIPGDELFENVESFPAESKLNDSSTSTPTITTNNVRGEKKEAKGEHGQAEESKYVSQEDEEQEVQQEEENIQYDHEDEGYPIRLPVDSTPEFMQLPLEYQGYCPWTIVEKGGLLLPGDPSLGVVQYHNSYHVFVNERALGEFMIHPKRYVNGILNLASKKPELIYLLRLQESFPNTDLSSLLKLSSIHQAHLNGHASIHPLLAPPAQQKVDASTSTPVHFVEKNLDYNYDWNEWNLRRKAIKIANLRKCKTVSCQTNMSHFRRDTDTQVYLAVENTSQTGKEQGTNPPRVVTYFAGLRGGKHTEVTKEESKEQDTNQPSVVSYTFEL